MSLCSPSTRVAALPSSLSSVAPRSLRSFDGQAWAIVVLANVHRDKLLGAIGYQRACGIGGLIVGEMSFTDRIRS